MVRLVGVLTGSLGAIALLIILVGIPEIRVDAPRELVARAPEPASIADTQPEPEPESMPDAVPEPTPEPVPTVASDPEPDPVTTSPMPPTSEPAADSGVAPAEPNWYAFWSPFHSELAANGFVSELQRTTGLDYRVVRIKTGVYEVAFAYSDDADIAAKLVRIAEATGLDIAGTE